MKRIVLACAAGMSTSMVVTRMEKEAAARGLAFQIYAIPEQNLREELQNYGNEVVVVLLEILMSCDASTLTFCAFRFASQGTGSR